MAELRMHVLRSSIETLMRINEKRQGRLVAWYEGLAGDDALDDIDTQNRIGHTEGVLETCAALLKILDDEKLDGEIVLPVETFGDGVRYALDYLAEIYDDINETDLWADYMPDDDDEN
jgi:hypothetical protein